ncbi:MAG TPA: MFS transporter, partial [Acidimicrobiales bacterium]|nr:MFS transporter [Acidimicrobiales bacterium]
MSLAVRLRSGRNSHTDDLQGPDRLRRRRLVLAVCSLSLFMVTLDNTIVNVALPSLQAQFHASVDELQWVADAYLLVLAALLLFAGSLGDRVGRRKILRTGLVLFGTGSLACSLAPSLPLLIGARMLQACGGCMLNPNSLSIISDTFREPGERASAIGVWGGVVGISTAAGPVLGGALIQAIDWRAIFWVNVPVVVAALVLIALFVPESRAARPRRLDVPGQVLAALLLGSTTYAIIEGPRLGWGSASIVGAACAALAALAAFLVVEHRQAEPLLELRFFRSPPFSGATAIATLAFVVLAGWLFLNTLYLQEVRGYSPLMAGVAALPATIVIVVVSPLTGKVVARHGARWPLTISGLLLMGGAGSLALAQPHWPYLYLAGGYLLIGLGFGMVNPPITNTAVSGMPRAQSGVAAAVASTARQVGSVLGVAVLGSVLTAELPSQLARLASRAHLPPEVRHKLLLAGARGGSQGGSLSGRLPPAARRAAADAFTASTHPAWL